MTGMILTGMTIRQLAEALLGTSEPLPDAVTDALDASELECLDAAVRRCGCCGWWVETMEIDEDGNCEECAQEARDWETAPGGSRGDTFR